MAHVMMTVMMRTTRIPGTNVSTAIPIARPVLLNPDPSSGVWGVRLVESSVSSDAIHVV